MSRVTDDTTTRQKKFMFLKKAVAAAALASLLTAGGLLMRPGAVSAAGETRTISLFHVHTKESLTITYKVNGRYVPSAMKKINYLMRDWRRNSVITIDPKTIDLMWELHADLGSRQPVHVICGYRSAKTNGFLKRIGRGVARKSQHVRGKAIDMFFPDVSTEKVRNSALVRRVGGVGYYRGRNGFVHIDSGNVRHWPRISQRQLAGIFRNYRKTIGARLSRKDQMMIATAETRKLTKLAAERSTAAYDDNDDEAPEAQNTNSNNTLESADTAIAAPMPRLKPDAPMMAKAPRPQPKPIEVLLMAASRMKIEPAAAPPEEQNFTAKSKPVADNMGAVAAAETLIEEPQPGQVSNIAAKSEFAAELRDGNSEKTPLIKPIMASAASDDLTWWPARLVYNADAQIRRDGAPQILDDVLAAPQKPEQNQQQAALTEMIVNVASSGKSDLLEVNRAAKGGLLTVIPERKKQKLGQLVLPEAASE
jgi:uncharacterized protein YcbK (DUF882 family)